MGTGPGGHRGTVAPQVVTRFVAGQSLGALNLRRLGPKRPYLWAWLLPPALAIVTGLFTLALGAGRLDLEFTAIREAMAQAPGGERVPSEMVVAIQVVSPSPTPAMINAASDGP